MDNKLPSIETLTELKGLLVGGKERIPTLTEALDFIDKKIKVTAFNFSEKAKEKLLSAKCAISYIIDEIKSNPSAKGIKILK